MKEHNTLTHREAQLVLVSVFPHQEKNTLTHRETQLVLVSVFPHQEKKHAHTYKSGHI